jgi:hypothetical protein
MEVENPVRTCPILLGEERGARGRGERGGGGGEAGGHRGVCGGGAGSSKPEFQPETRDPAPPSLLSPLTRKIRQGHSRSASHWLPCADTVFFIAPHQALFFVTLAQVLADNGKDATARQSAGIVMKNALDAQVRLVRR